MLLFLKRYKILFSIFFIISCDLTYFQENDINGASINTSLSVPVGEINFNIDDMVNELSKNANIKANAENIPTFIYVDTLNSQRVEEFLEINNQNFSEIITPPITNNLSGAIPFTVNRDQDLNFNIDLDYNRELDSLYISEGQMVLTIESTFSNFRVNFDLTVPSLIDSAGNVLTISGSFEAPSAPSFTYNQNLANFIGDFSSPNNLSGGILQAHIDYEIIVSPMSEIMAGDRIDLNINIQDLGFNSFFGRVGTENLEINDVSVSVDFFSSFGTEGSINFGSPSIKVIADNSFGFPLGLNLQNIQTQKEGAQPINLDGAVTNSLSNIKAPRVNQYGTVIRSEILLNTQNSNIDSLLNSKPDEFLVRLTAMPNPANALPQYNFIDKESKLDIFIEINIPLDISLNNLQVKDTTSFSTDLDLEELKNLKLILLSENTMPVGGRIGINFLDSLNNTLLTIEPKDIIIAPSIGSNGRVTKSTNKMTEIPLTEEDVKNIEKTTSIETIFTIKTTNTESGTTVKFF